MPLCPKFEAPKRENRDNLSTDKVTYFLNFKRNLFFLANEPFVHFTCIRVGFGAYYILRANAIQIATFIPSRLEGPWTAKRTLIL